MANGLGEKCNSLAKMSMAMRQTGRCTLVDVTLHGSWLTPALP